MVIFTTAYTEHAVTSFELDAVDYLLKPFSLSRFIKGCNKAFELYNFRNGSPGPDHLYVIPATYIIDKKGNVRFKTIGFEGPVVQRKIEVAIEMLQAGDL